MSEKNIFEVLRDGGFKKRPKTVFVDNRDKRFEIAVDGQTATVIVLKTVDDLKMSARYEFDLSAEKTNADKEEVAEIKRWLEIRPFDGL